MRSSSVVCLPLQAVFPGFFLANIFFLRYDTQHNDIQHSNIQHNDIQHNNKIIKAQTLSGILKIVGLRTGSSSWLADLKRFFKDKHISLSLPEYKWLGNIILKPWLQVNTPSLNSSTSQQPRYLSSHACLLNKNSCLALILCVTKFIIVTDMNWVTLYCLTQVGLCSTNQNSC